MAMQPASQSRRRDKPVLSCNFCRGRKLRCDRNSPCGACVRRGQPAECTYSSSEQQRKNAVDYRPHARSQRARQRIARLESLVGEIGDIGQSSKQATDRRQSLAQASSHDTPQANPSNDRMLDGMGKLSITNDHAVYIGSSHWATILDDIRRLKDELSEDLSDEATSQESSIQGADLPAGLPAARLSLLAGATCLPREQILAMLPSRRVVDRLISQFFNEFDLAPFILNRGVFLSEYASFWTNPSTTPIMWLGLLFSVLSMSAFLSRQDAGASDTYAEPDELLDTYRTLTIHCLVAGDYMRPSRYTIETLIFHFAANQQMAYDVNIDNWLLIGVIVRIALRMGLHRDPSHWPDIRPLQAELRRRIWITLYQMDFFTSIQIGLPRIIKDSQCDARPPAHVFDHDISAEDEKTPSERPLTDSTPLLYIIQRNAIIKVAAEIYDLTEATPPPPATVVALDAKLESAVEAIPTWLKYSSLETSIVDSPITILYRVTLDVLVQKATYLLHRWGFMENITNAEHRDPHRQYIDAALKILEHQRKITEETQPGGLLFGLRWKVEASLNHEFLQATMIACFALSKFDERCVGSLTPCVLYRQDDILEALVVAETLWEKRAGRSEEARRAIKAIKAVTRQSSSDSHTPAMTSPYNHSQETLEEIAHNYFHNLDSGSYMALDPFLGIDNDATVFGNIVEDFGAGRISDSNELQAEDSPSTFSSVNLDGAL